jgi:ComEC/Rec2-related protein
MAWVLASTLAMGITGDARLAWVALVFFVRWACCDDVSKSKGVLVASVAILFFAYGRASITGIRRDIAATLAVACRSEAPVRLEGWVCGFPYYSYGGMAFDFRTRVGERERIVHVRTREFLVSYGDSLRVRGVWRWPRDIPEERWSARLLATGVCGEFRAFPGEVQVLPGVGGSWIAREVFFPCHDRVRRELCRGLGSKSGIAIGLLIGERGYIDRRASNAFRTLGISHLLALSGQHLGYVAAALVVLMRVLRRRWTLAILFALASYVAVVGPIISLYRSFVMAAVLILASMLKRALDPVTALVHAFIIVVLFYPHSFFSVASQLSFIATFAVVLSLRTLRRPESAGIACRAGFWIRSSLQVSLAAQLFVTPLIIHYFGVVSLWAPLATLVFGIPVAFILFYSGFAVLLAVLAPFANALVFAGLDWAAAIFEKGLVASADSVPGMVSPVAPDVWLYYGGLCFFAVARGRLWPKIVGTVALVLSFALEVLRRELS